MKTNTNDPINPTPIAANDLEVISAEAVSMTFPGLTKGEYFAAMAMHGLLAGRHNNLTKETFKEFASISLMCADALIEALNREDDK